MLNIISTFYRNKLSNSIFILIAVSFSVLSLLNNQVFKGKTNVITYDAYGYYAYLPAIFIYSDAVKYDFVEEHFNEYDVSADIYQVRPVDKDVLLPFYGVDTDISNEKQFPIYNIGLAVLWFPFFIIAHTFSLISSTYNADGLSFPYQVSIVVASIFFGIIGLYNLKNILQYLFNEFTAISTIVLILFATNYYYYSLNVPGLTHIYLFSIYAVMLTYIVRYFEQEKRSHLIIIGILCGMCVLIRSSEIVIFILIALYGLTLSKALTSLKYILNFSKQRAKPLFGIILVSVLVFLIQIAYYKGFTGYWFLNGYAGHYFELLNPHLYEGLFGYRRGMFIYTPIMVFAMIGFYPLYKTNYKWTWAIAIFFLVNIYLLFSWHIWWYGNTFGSRPVIQSYAILALPLAAFIYYIFTWRRKIIACAVTVIFLFFIFLNIFQTWQFKQRILPLDFVNKTYYWHVFLSTSHSPNDYKYLDTNEKMPPGNYSSTNLWELDNPLWVKGKNNDEYEEFHNLFKSKVNDTLANNLSKNWLRTKIDVSYYGDHFDKWSAPKFVISFTNKHKENIKWEKLRIPVVMKNKKRDTITFNVKSPYLQKGDMLKIFVWNTTVDSFLIHDTDISALREN